MRKTTTNVGAHLLRWKLNDPVLGFRIWGTQTEIFLPRVFDRVTIGAAEQGPSCPHLCTPWSKVSGLQAAIERIDNQLMIRHEGSAKNPTHVRPDKELGKMGARSIGCEDMSEPAAILAT